MMKFYFLLILIAFSQFAVAQDDCDDISGTISPGSAEICQGESVVLTVIGTGATNYEWRLNDVVIQGEIGESITVSQEGTYTVILKKGNCSEPASNSTTVTVNALPTASISPSSGSICNGGSIVLTANASSSGPGGLTYRWFRNSDEINGQNGSTLTVTEPGTYGLTVEQNGCIANASNTSVITESAGPTGSITPSNASICQGGSVTLTATGGTSYTWFRNGVQIGGETGATLTVEEPGSYTATIHQGSCSAPASNNSVVSITSAPTGSISPANASVCPGGSIILTASGGTSYTWFRNGTEIPGVTGANLTVEEPGTYTATIHQGECNGSASNSSVVTLASAPTGNITPATGSICQGGSIVLTATGGSSYTWFRNGTQIGGVTGATLEVEQPGTYTVTIRQGDCSGPASNSSVITLSSGPTGTITPATGTICEGNSIILTASGGSSYTWFRNGNQINGVTDATLETEEPGTYTVLIHQGECSAQASNSSIITLSSGPTGSISPATSSVCPGESQVLTATGGDSYTWFFNGVILVGENDATITALVPGTYTATIHQGDCSGPASNSATVNLAIAPSGTISPATGSICAGGSLTLEATGGTSYTWFRNGVEIPNEDDSRITVTEPGSYSATVRKGLCSGPASNTAEITAASAPTGTISPATGSICPSSSMILTASGGTSYTWFRNGVQINGEDDATLTVSQPGTYTATIRQGDCSGPAANSSVITLASAPSGTIAPAIASICEGGSVLLTATGGTTYVWYRNGIIIPGQNTATLSVTLAGTYSVTINQGDCSGPASNTSVITFSTRPTGTISPAVATLCGGNSQVLTATGGTSYTWSRDGVEINGEESATLTVTEPGTYSVIIRNGTCTGPASNNAIVTTESVVGTRYPDVEATANVPVQLSARDIGATFEWAPASGVDNPSSRTPMATTSTDREYTVRITTEKGCAITDTVLVKIGVIKAKIFVPTAFTPDRNGVNDFLRALGDISAIETFRVFNRWGQLMFETKEIGAGWDGTYKGVNQPSDTYTWLLNGTDVYGQPIKLSGKTLLIR